MRTKRKFGTSFLATLVAVIMAIGSLSMLVGCGDKEDDPKDSTGTITLSNTTLSVIVGETVTLTAETSDANATVTWESSNPAVATVLRGRVTGVSAGTTTVKASVSDAVYAECAVTVNEDTRTITLDKSTATVDVATSTTLTLTPTVSDANAAVEWSSSDSNVATVNDSGVVTLKKTKLAETTVTITAKIRNSSVSTTCVITVQNTNIPEDYAELAKNDTKANLISEQGTFDDQYYYFIKSKHADRVTFDDQFCGASTPYYANGAVYFEFSKASSVEDDETQYELRYQPGKKVGLAAGDVYSLTLKIDTNVAGKISFNKGCNYVEGYGSYYDKEQYTENPDPQALQNVVVGTNTITLTNCVVDDGRGTEGNPLAIRPRIYSLPENGDNLVIKIYDLKFEKTGTLEDVGGEGDGTYKVLKANNSKIWSDAAYKGQWAYYQAAASVTAGGSVEAVGNSNTGVIEITYSGYFYDVGAGKSQERLYYMPDVTALGTSKVTLTFDIELSVAGSIKCQEGAAGNANVTLEADTVKTVTLTCDVSAENQPVRLDLMIEEALPEGGSVVITISNFTCVATPAAE